MQFGGSFCYFLLLVVYGSYNDVSNGIRPDMIDAIQTEYSKDAWNVLHNNIFMNVFIKMELYDISNAINEPYYESVPLKWFCSTLRNSQTKQYPLILYKLKWALINEHEKNGFGVVKQVFSYMHLVFDEYTDRVMNIRNKDVFSGAVTEFWGIMCYNSQYKIDPEMDCENLCRYYGKMTSTHYYDTSLSVYKLILKSFESCDYIPTDCMHGLLIDINDRDFPESKAWLYDDVINIISKHNGIFLNSDNLFMDIITKIIHDIMTRKDIVTHFNLIKSIFSSRHIHSLTTSHVYALFIGSIISDDKQSTQILEHYIPFPEILKRIAILLENADSFNDIKISPKQIHSDLEQEIQDCIGEHGLVTAMVNYDNNPIVYGIALNYFAIHDECFNNHITEAMNGYIQYLQQNKFYTDPEYEAKVLLCWEYYFSDNVLELMSIKQILSMMNTMKKRMPLSTTIYNRILNRILVDPDASLELVNELFSNMYYMNNIDTVTCELWLKYLYQCNNTNKDNHKLLLNKIVHQMHQQNIPIYPNIFRLLICNVMKYNISLTGAITKKIIGQTTQT